MSVAVSGPYIARLLGSWRASGPAYGALAGALRLLVLDGRLPLRTRLPGERELAEALGVSRTTATAAYTQLREEGFLVSRRGSGSWTRLPADRPAPPAPGPPGPELIDLSTAAGAAPAGALHAALAAATEELPRHFPGPGYVEAGLPVLRAAIAERFTRRGAPTTPDQILVTSGALHAFSLLLRVFAGPGDRVLAEAPSYPAALDAIRATGARVVPVPVGDLDLLEATLRQAAPRLAYLVPDHHNPTGLSLSDGDRERLVALARATRTPLAIDEAMAELHLDGGPPTPVAAFDPAGETAIVAGSMSKGYWGGLRVGWIRATPATIDRLVAARATLDLASPVIEQLMAAELLKQADDILPRQRELFRARRDALAAALPPEWRFTLPAGGLCLWVELDAPRSTALAAIADNHGVRIAAGPRFGVDGAFERFVRLPYALPEAVLEEAMARLAVAWRAVSEGAPAEHTPVALIA